jgi:hypothetical protein
MFVLPLLGTVVAVAEVVGAVIAKPSLIVIQ